MTKHLSRTMDLSHLGIVANPEHLAWEYDRIRASIRKHCLDNDLRQVGPLRMQLIASLDVEEP